MARVHLLWFVQEQARADDIELLIGVFTTERNALRAIDTLKGLPGFVDFPQGFQIHAREPNKLSWTEGFARSS
jgi:homoserine kinase type II